MVRVRSVIGAIFFLVGATLILLGIGVLLMWPQAAPTPAGAVAFILFWWLPLVIFGVPGLALAWFGYKLWTSGRSVVPTAVPAVQQQVVMASAIPLKVCPKCNRQVPGDAKFCPYCGYEF